MLALVGALMLLVMVAGPALITGHPLLIVIGVALGAAVIVASRRRANSRASR